MKAATYPGKGQPITIETLPDPEPGADDIIIKVHHCGACGTHLSMTKGEMWDYGACSQLSHEYAGEIVALGFCTQPDPFMPSMAAYKCATMQFLVGYTMDEFHYIADQMDKGHVDLKTIITSTAPLDTLPATFTLLRGSNSETKVHILT